MQCQALVLITLLALSVLASSSVYRPAQDCVASGTEGIPLFPEQFILVGGEQTDENSYVEVTTAWGFSVEYFDSYKVVNNSIAGELYVLYQCGADPPSPVIFPSEAKFFQIPLVSVSMPDTVSYAAMVTLNLTDRAYDAPAFVVAPCGQVLVACNRIAPDFSQLDNVTLMESLVGNVVDGVVNTVANPFSKSFAFSSSQDPGLLNRVEWLKFLGLFFNMEREASTIFEGIATNFTNFRAAVAKQIAENSTKPVTAFVSHFYYEGSPESYQISWAAYKAELASDAGAVMPSFAEVAAIPGVQPDTYDPTTTLDFGWSGNGTFPDQQAALDAFLGVLSKVDVIIDETYSPVPSNYTVDTFLSAYNLTEEEAERQQWFANKKIFREDGLLSVDEGLDWFEGALMAPSLVLKDMIRAVRPSLAEDPNSFIWIRNLFTETPVVVGPSACTSPTSCNSRPVPICPFVQPCPGNSSEYTVESALLKGTVNGACIYEKCVPVSTGATSPDPPSPAEDSGDVTNAAQLAAPAVILMTLVVVLVEVLLNCF